MRKKWTQWITAMALAAVMTSCGGDDTFRIIGDVDELGTQNLRFVYMSNGALQSVNTTAVDGQFSFEGRSEQPTLVEVYTSAFTLIGRFVARNGETVKCRFAMSDPWKMSAEGNGDTERLAKFFTENHDILAGGDAAAINAKIAEFVGKNKDRLASTVLMSRYFAIDGYQQQADSLMGLINQKARPTYLAADFYYQTSRSAEVPDSVEITPIKVVTLTDSLVKISPSERPYTLFAFTKASDRRADSIVRAMRSATGKATVVDVSLDPDTMTWRRSLAQLPDSLRGVRRVWAMGGEGSPWLAPMRVYKTPLFLLVDSTGTALFRGPSTTRVETLLK